MASLPETDSTPTSTHAQAQGSTMPVHGHGHSGGGDQPAGAAEAAPPAGSDIGQIMSATVPNPARVIPAPRTQMKEIKCMYIDNCDTGSQPRKAISHIFGRNKLCTRSIPQHVWVHYCRKHYQRSRYRNAHEYAKLQADLVQKQIDRVQQWSDENERAGQPGVVSNWSLSIRKREQRRLEDKTGGGKKRTFSSTSIGNNQNNDSDDDDGGGGGAGAGPVDPDTAELNGTAVPDWVLDKCGAGYDTAAIMAIVQRLKVDIEGGALSQIPDIEILPNIRGDGPDGTKAKAAAGAKRKTSVPADSGAVAAAAAHKRSQSMGVAAMRTDYSIGSSHQMARRISQPGTHHQYWTPDGGVVGVGGGVGSGGVGGGNSAAPFEKRQRLNGLPPADIPAGAQPSSIGYHSGDNRHGYGSGVSGVNGVSSVSSVVRNTERTVPMMMHGGGIHHGSSSGSNGGNGGNINHNHPHLGMTGPASFDDGDYMYRDGRQSQNLPAMPMMNFGTPPLSSRPTGRPPPGGPPAPSRRPSMMPNLDPVSMPAGYPDRRRSPHQRSHSDMVAFQSGGYDTGGSNSGGGGHGGHGGHDGGGSVRPVQQNSGNGNIPRFSGSTDYRYDSFDSQAGYDMTPPPNQYGGGGSRTSYYDESAPSHGYAYNFQGAHASAGPQQHQQQQQSQHQQQQSQHQPRQLTGQMGDADATPHHTRNRGIPLTLRGQGVTAAQGGGGYYQPLPLPPLQQQQPQENQQQRSQADDSYDQHHSSIENNNNGGMHARAAFYPGQHTGNIQAGPQSRISAEEEDTHGGQHHQGYPPHHY